MNRCKPSFNVTLNKLLNKQSSCWWFETPWRSCDVNVMVISKSCHRYPKNKSDIRSYIWRHILKKWCFISHKWYKYEIWNFKRVCVHARVCACSCAFCEKNSIKNKNRKLSFCTQCHSNFASARSIKLLLMFDSAFRMWYQRLVFMLVAGNIIIILHRHFL